MSNTDFSLVSPPLLFSVCFDEIYVLLYVIVCFRYKFSSP